MYARAFLGLIVVAVLSGVIYAVYSAGKDAGLGQGDKEGYERGVRRTNELRDKELRAVLAEAREAAEKARADGFQKALEQERARVKDALQQAEDAKRQQRAMASSFDSLRRRLRERESQAASAAAGRADGMPGTGPAAPNATDPAGDVLRTGEELLSLAEAAEYESGRYGQCYRWVYGDGVRTE